ncbi:MAG: type II toxin-antitoxin system RelE/ParE family toxin [Oscillatoriales cyanobacterium]|jgi:mRNA interferase RelE/StbE|nr:MAG: type II toxin-antitoxin system RelE/ParE family toxin [Oscillatoriales cyanobacterium]TAH22276.1 MAG: type II toxin-antitoxin system RelE/ParE family toxin [Oscillatoriales cyanobacterium]
MSYEVGFKPAALRQLRKLDVDVQVSIVAAIESLAEYPRPEGCKKLKGETDLYRIRVANKYRVIYQIQDNQLLITVVKVGHRRDIYR